MAPFDGISARFDHCRIDEESRLYLRGSQDMYDASEHICGENGTQYVPFWHSPQCAPQGKPQHNACEQAEMILYAALDPSIASRARRGEFVQWLDHFDLIQTAIN